MLIMADDERCKAAMMAVERLQGMISNGYSIRIQQVNGRMFIFANHFVRGNLAGQGHSLEQAVLDLKSNEEDL